MDCDVFVSYAHRDNRALDGQRGFVTRLTESVQILAEQSYGSDLLWFLDKDLASGTRWKDEILERLAVCRVFIPIVSPSWRRSEWTAKEWDAVWERTKDDRRLGNQTRIIPIGFELQNTPIRDLPAEVRALQFCHRFQNMMTHAEFDKESYGLASEIAELLVRLDTLGKSAGSYDYKA